MGRTRPARRRLVRELVKDLNGLQGLYSLLQPSLSLKYLSLIESHYHPIAVGELKLSGICKNYCIHFKFILRTASP